MPFMPRLMHRTVESLLPDLQLIPACVHSALVESNAPIERHATPAVGARHSHQRTAALGAPRDP
jgi:hypothetical protein